MPSSIKMIKANKVYGGTSSAKIETQIEVTEEKTPAYEQDNPLETEVKIAQKKSRMIIEQAKMEAEKLKEEAKIKIEKMREKAYEEAVLAGQEAGYQQGLSQGLTEGLEQAMIQNEELKSSIMVMLQKTQAEIRSYQEDKKDEIIKLASRMAEKIVHDYIETSDEGLIKLVMPFIYQLDKDEEFVSITTHPQQQKAVEEQIHKIETVSPSTRFIVFADPSLEKNGLVIESSKQVIDLQIKKQITQMLQEFEEMERTVND